MGLFSSLGKIDPIMGKSLYRITLQSFIDYINRKAKKTERRIMQQIDDYSHYLHVRYALAQHKISTSMFTCQVDLLRMQISEAIASAVSGHMPAIQAECRKICWSSENAKKKAFQALSAQIIQEGVDKCAELAQSVFDYIEQDLCSSLQEKADTAQLQLEQMQQELTQLVQASENQEQQQAIKAKAELIVQCCNMTENLFGKEAD